MGQRLAGLLVLGVLTALGCKAPPPEVPEKVIPVEVAPVAPGPMADRLTIRAATEPWRSVRLSAEVAGQLVFIAKDEGEPVRKGERLFGIDKATYEARLRQAKALAAYQVVNFTRSEKLFADKALSGDQLDKARADRDAALAAVQTAEAELAKTDVFSPIDGVLDDKAVEVGEFMAPGSVLGDLVDTSRIKVIVPVPEKDVVYVRPGMAMTVVIDALGFAESKGEVIFVKQVADPDTLTFAVHLAVVNPEGRIRPGMIARAMLVRQQLDDAIGVPLFAVMRRVDGYHVFVEQNGVARRRDVTLGFPDEGRWQVASGLKAGDRLIVRGQRDLVDGDLVTVVGAGGESSAAPPDRAGGTEAGTQEAGGE